MMANRKRFLIHGKDGEFHERWGYPVDFKGERFFIHREELEDEWSYTHEATGKKVNNPSGKYPNVKFKAGTRNDLPTLEEIEKGVGPDNFWEAIRRSKAELGLIAQ